MSITDYLPTDGPGHSNQPQTDIETHRQIAWLLRWMGLIGLVAFGLLYITQDGWQYLGAASGSFVVCHQASSQLRIEALEWELALEREG